LLGKHSGYLERFALYTVRKKDFTDSEINAEVIERLQEAARKRSRYGHCDTTMMLVAGFVRRRCATSVGIKLISAAAGSMSTEPKAESILFIH
jgi:hypothetical protein